MTAALGLRRPTPDLFPTMMLLSAMCLSFCSGGLDHVTGDFILSATLKYNATMNNKGSVQVAFDQVRGDGAVWDLQIAKNNNNLWLYRKLPNGTMVADIKKKLHWTPPATFDLLLVRRGVFFLLFEGNLESTPLAYVERPDSDFVPGPPPRIDKRQEPRTAGVGVEVSGDVQLLSQKLTPLRFLDKAPAVQVT